MSTTGYIPLSATSLDQLATPSATAVVTPTRFDPPRKLDPRQVAAITTSIIPDVAPKFISIKTFSAQAYDIDGNRVGKVVTRDAEYHAHQDVADLIVVRNAERGPEIALTKLLRPAVALRQEVGAIPDPDSGIIWNLPGVYIRVEQGESNLERSIDVGLPQKVGVVRGPGDSIESLGGSYLPSVGGSTENAIPRIIILANNQDETTSVAFGKDFQGQIVRQYFSPQEIVNGYFDGSIRCVRAVLAAFRVAEKFQIQLSIPKKLPELGASIPFSESLLELKKPAEIVSISKNGEKKAGEAIYVSVEPSNTQNAFLKSVVFTAHNVNTNGEVLNSYRAEAVVRKGFDSVDTTAHCLIRDSAGKEHLCMAIKTGLRETLAVRDLEQHPIYFETNHAHLEGIAETLEGENSETAVISRAKKGVQEEAGVAVIDAKYLGAAYPSSGTGIELAHSVATLIDPRTASISDSPQGEVVNRFLADVDDIIALGNQGFIKDPRMLVNAYILKHGYRYQQETEINNHPRANPARARLEGVMNQGDPASYWIDRVASESHRALLPSSTYRRLFSYNVNEVGLQVGRTDHSEERFVFDGALPYFMQPLMPDMRKMPFNLVHDLKHWVLGGMAVVQFGADGSVLRDNRGTPIFVPFEEYRRGNSGNECVAVHLSDVVIPNEFGHDASEKIFGGVSVGRALAQLGFSEQEAMNIIFSVERDGIIPANVLNHPQYKDLEGIIVGRLLKYHVLDGHHLRKMYDNMVQHPEVAVGMVTFCERAFCDVKKHEAWFEDSVAMIQRYPEGINPLRAAISSCITGEIGATALQLLTYKEQVMQNGRMRSSEVTRRIDRTVLELKSAKEQLAYAKSLVRDFEISPDNLEAFSWFEDIRRQIVGPAMRYSRILREDTGVLTSEQIAANAGRVLPFLRALPFGLTDEMKAEMKQLVAKSYELAGISQPQ